MVPLPDALAAGAGFDSVRLHADVLARGTASTPIRGGRLRRQGMVIRYGEGCR